MIALVILFGLLSALIMPGVMQRLSKTQRSAVRSDLVALDSAVEQWALFHDNRHPESLELLVTPDADGNTMIKSTMVPRDPWKREYLYAPPSADQPLPRIWTLGKDGLPGGDGDDLDVDNLMIRAGEIGCD